MSPTVVAYLLLFALGGAIRATHRRRARGQSPPRESKSGVVLGLAHAATMISGVLFPSLGIGALPVGERFGWIAVAAMVAALALQIWAMATLGPLFTLTLQADARQEVVARGPYRLVRHPGYLAQLSFFVAFGLACRNALTLAVILVIDVAAYVYRIRIEERLLRETLDRRYDAYAAGRARLVPGIW